MIIITGWLLILESQQGIEKLLCNGNKKYDRFE